MKKTLSNEKYYYDKIEREVRMGIVQINEDMRREYLDHIAENYIAIIK